LLSEQELLSLANTLSRMGVQDYALQVFRPQGCRDAGLNATATSGYPGGEVVSRIAALFPRFTLRQANH